MMKFIVKVCVVLKTFLPLEIGSQQKLQVKFDSVTCTDSISH